jgi:hypothetical protein
MSSNLQSKAMKEHCSDTVFILCNISSISQCVLTHMYVCVQGVFMKFPEWFYCKNTCILTAY